MYARSLTSLVAGTLILAACGGSRMPTPAPARVTRGAITAKAAGSITVNGVQLTTAAAVVKVEGQPGGVDDLQVGMVVTVKGAFDDRLGGAAEIAFDDSVRGKVVSVSGGVVDVGGVSVHVDPMTVGSAVPGHRVRVSGLPDDKGGVRASRIDDDPGVSQDLELKGFVSALNVGAATFELRLTPDAPDFLVVSHAGITLPAAVVNGAFVEVRSAGPATGTPPTLIATDVEVEDRFHGAEGEVELEGIVCSSVTPIAGGLFAVDGVTVQTDVATRFENGAAVDLVRGVKVEVDGVLAAGGVLHAEKVSFRDVVRITAPVGAVAPGSLTILGIEVLLSDFVDLDENLGGPIAPGHVVQVRGYPKDGKVVALRVDDRSGENRITLQGVATAKDDATPAQPSFVVMGIHVHTDGSSEFRDVADAALTAPQLFAAVEVDRTVLEVRTRSNPDATDVVVSPPDSTLLARSIELEGDK